MNDSRPIGPALTRLDKSIFTILGGTTTPDRAALVRTECREGSRVELRRQPGADPAAARIDVWLECTALLGLVKAWKQLRKEPPRSVVVTSGTGSGKTECFLVPILDDLARQVRDRRR